MTPSARRSFRAALLAGTALLACPLAAGAQPAANVRPTGGAVVAGAATISQGASTTTITQSSQRAAINWQSFDVGAQQSVQFQQPSASAVALNRVLGPNPSQIAGRIDANGQIILINPDGITFYRGAQVNAAGFVATAAGMANQDFMAGRMAFSEPAQAGARIVNAGTITVKQAGLAALVAPQVANSGVISAKFGHVVLAGARTATLDLYGDGLLALDVSNQVVEAPGGAAALVTNSGLIVAAGGTVQLTARAADGVVQTLVQAGGRIAAPDAGSIVLDGIGGDITVTGQLAATGPHGGKIEVLPSGTATIAAGARLDASGAAGGGVVAVGTTLARASGGPAVTGAARAAATVVQAGAQIAADAMASGNGGRVAVLATGATTMNGMLSARGGPHGGNGGFIEVSGNVLDFSGVFDVGAPAVGKAGGVAGTLLLDPATLDITAGQTAALDASASGSNILLQASTLLDVQAALNFANPVNVTLQSGHTLIVDSGIAVLALQTGSALTLQSGFSGGAVVAGRGSLVLDGATLAAPDLLLQAGSGIVLGSGKLTAGTLDLGTAGGDVTQAAAGVLNVGLLQSSLGIAGTADLIGANTISALGAVVASGGVTIDNHTSLIVAGLVAAGGGSLSGSATLDLVNTAGLSIGAAGTLAASLMSLTASSIVQTSGIISTNSLNATATAGSAALASPQNTIGIFGTIAATGGDVVLANAQNVIIEGTLSGTNLLVDAAVGTGTLALGTGNGFATAATLTPGPTGRISLVADNISAGKHTTLNGSGAVEIAPFSTATPETLGSGSGLAIDATLLGQIAPTGTLVLGRVTPVLGLGTVVAHGVSIPGTVDPGSVAPVLDLASSAGVTEASGGKLTVTTLESSAGITGTVNLAGTKNAIGTLGPFGVTTGDLRLADTGNLTLTGAISLGASHTLALGSTGTVSESAAILTAGTLASAGTIGGDLLLGGAGNSISAIGSLTVTGNATLADAVPLNIAGPFSAANATFNNIASLSETSGATISLGGGAGTLAGSGDGAFALGSTNNSIGVLGALALTGDLTLAGKGALSVTGPVTAANASLSAGTLTLAGTVSLTAGGVLALGSGGTVDQTAGSINATTLAGAGTIGGDLVLDGGSNSYSSIGSLHVVGNVTLADTVALAIAGPFTAAGATFDTIANLTEATGATISLGTLTGSGGTFALGSTQNTIATIGSLALGIGTLTLADSRNLTLDGPLTAASATFVAVPTLSEASGATISLGTLAGSGGTFSLASTHNSILSVGSVALSGGLTLADKGALSVAGPVTAANATFSADTLTLAGVVNVGSLGVLALGSTGTVTESGATLTAGTLAGSGSVGAGTIGGDLTLDGSNNSFLTLGSLHVIGNATLADTAALAIAGPFTAANASFVAVPMLSEASGATISLGTLTATAGSIALASAHNSIGVADGVTASSGDLALTDGGSLLLKGTLSGNNLAITVAHSLDTLDLGSAVLSAASLGRVALVADTLANTGGLGSLTAAGGAVELAPFSATPFSLGVSGSTIAVNGTALPPITAATLSIGGIAGTPMASLVTLAGPVDLSLLFATLDLLSKGAITAPASLHVGTLLAQAGTGLTLDAAGNSIAVLGAVTAGNITLADGVALNIAGPLSATSATFDVAALSEAAGATISLGTLAGAGTTFALGSTLNAIATVGSLALGTLTLADTGHLTLAGPLSATSATITADTLSETGGATLSLGTLSGGGGTFELSGGQNSILSVGGIALSGNLTLADKGALGVNGPVTAANATLSADTLTLAGIVNVGAGTLALGSTGMVTESGATITAGTLAGAGTIGGDLQFGGGGNDFATLGSLHVTGSATLADTAPLAIAGPFTATSATFDVANLSEAAGATISLGTLAGSGGTFALASTGNTILSVGSVALSGDLTLADKGALGVNGPVTAADATLSADTLTLAGIVNVGAGTLALGSTGAVTESGATLTAGTLAGDGSIGTLLLGGANNSFSTLGSLNVTGAMTLADGVALSIAGPLTATSATFDVAALSEAAGATISLGTLAGAGTTFALGSTLNAIATVGSLALGTLTLADTGHLTLAGPLSATSATITADTLSETGGATLSLGTLSGGGGTFELSGGQNSILSVGGIALSGNLTLADKGALGVNGPVTAANATLSADTLTLAGIVNVGAGTLALGSTGMVTESGATITAGTLAGAGTIGGDLQFGGGGNDFATLGSLNVTGSATLADTAALAIAGPFTATSATFDVANLSEVSGATVSLGTLAGSGGTYSLVSTGNTIATLGSVALSGDLTLADKGALGVNGPVTAADATLSADTLTLAGIVNVGAGTLALGSTGAVTESGATLTAGTLAGDGSIGTLLLGGANNSFSTLGSLNVTGAMTLADGVALNIAGPLSATSATFDVAALSEAAGATISLGTLAGAGTTFALGSTLNAIATVGSLALGTLTLADTGHLTLAGPLSATSATITADTLSETGGATLSLGTLSGGGGTFELSGGQNSILSVGGIALSGNLTLADKGALSVNGPVTAANATLSADTLTLAGIVNVGAGTLALGSTGMVTESGATITAGTLAGAGTIGGDLQFGGGGNDFATLGSLNVTGSATLADTAALAIAGPFTATSATFDVANLSEVSGATVSLGTLAGSGGTYSLVSTGNTIATLGSVALSGDLTLADKGALGVNGPVTAADATLSADTLTLAGIVNVGAGTLALGSPGAVTESGATLTAGTLAGDGSIGTLLLVAGSNSIATIGSLTVGGNITLVDSGPLTLTGPVSAAAAALTADTLTLAGPLALGGGALALTSSGTVQETAAAVLTAGTLTASAAALDLAAGSNAITTLGAVGIIGGATLVEAGALSVTGPVTANAVSLQAGTLGIAGSVVASSAALTAGGGGLALDAGALVDGSFLVLTSAGPLTLAGGSVLGDPAAAVVLNVSAGGIIEAASARILAATLQSFAGIAGTADLAGTANAIATLSGFAATGDLIVEDGGTGSLTLAGTVGAGGRVAIGTVAAPGSLALTGTLTGASVTLASGAGGSTLAGTLATGTLALGSAGSVQEGTATLAVATLESSGTIAGGVTLGGSANSIATLGSFSVAGGLTLADATALTVAGPVGAGAITFAVQGPLALAGTLAAPVIDLSSTGNLTQTTSSALQTARLLSSQGIGGSATFAGTANAIGTLGPLAAAGALTLADASPLTVAPTSSGGPVTAPQITLTAPGIQLPAGAALGTPGATLDVSSTGSLIEAAGATLTAALLLSSGGIGGDATLAGSANAIATLGGFGVGGALVLADSTALTVAGPVAAGSVALATPDALTLAGSLAAPQVTLDVGALALAAGAVLGETGAALDLTTTAGGIAENAAARLLATALTSGGGIAGDAILAGTANAVATLGAFAAAGTLLFADSTPLTVTGPVAAAAIGIADAVGIGIGGPVSTAGTLAFDTGAGGLLIGSTLAAPLITVASSGPVQLATGANVGAPGAVLDLSTSAGGVTEVPAGTTITAATLTSRTGIVGDAMFGGTANAIGTLANMAATGTLALTDSTALTLAGTLTAPELLLAVQGNVQEGQGAVLALGTLASAGVIGGTASFAGPANAIGTLGPLSAAGGLVLTDGVPLTVAGSVGAPTVTLTAPALDLTGALAATTAIMLTAPSITLAGGAAVSAPGVVIADGGVTEAASAALTATTLSSNGPIAGNVVLAGTANAVATLDGFAATQNFTLDDAVALTLAGVLAAPRIVIDSEGHPVTFAAGASIATDGAAAPSGGAFNTVAPPIAANGAAGAYLTVGSLTQTGSFSVAGLTGATSLLRIDAINGGSISFDRIFGLFGQDSWLILGLTEGQGIGQGGRASGNLFVKSLSVVYPTGAIGISTDLFGTINQLSGPAAAGTGGIAPLPSSTIRLNDCPIHSIDCVLLAVQTIPAASPLQNFSIGTMFNRGDEDDLLLPIVSDQDY